MNKAQQIPPMLIGASWYPEMWSETECARDLDRMVELGFNIVRVFEFAWHKMEPAEAKFDAKWPVWVMDQCHRRGIAVMAGTPTAAPPAWLTSRYPDVLRTNHGGRRATHGGRRHYNPASSTYLRFCGQVAGEMARALAGHPALHSWQIDNEIAGQDFSDETLKKFHLWLAGRYGTVQALNDAWGLEFWSQAYDSFDQVPLPVAGGSAEFQERHHPSLVMAAHEFSTDVWDNFIAVQCDAIRKHSDKPITHNMCGSAMGVDWFRLNRRLDHVGFSLYKDVVHYPWNVMFLDRMRGEKPRPYWLLETAPNWSGGFKQWNIHHNAAGVQAMTWLSAALGGSMMLYWQWRSHWAGQEMLHGTCVDAAGKWRPNREAWTKLAKGFACHGQWLSENPPTRARMGMFLSTQAFWAFGHDPIDDNMDYISRWRDDFYQPIVQSHLWRDVTSEQGDFERYDVLLMPLMPSVKPETRTRLVDWVKRGGRLLLGPLTGFRSTEMTCFTERSLGGLEDLVGAEVAMGFTAHWREAQVRIETADGTGTPTRAWCKAFSPTKAEAIAWYRGAGEYGNGLPAVVRHRLGKGEVITIGGWVSSEFYLKLLASLTSGAAITPSASGDSDVLVVPRGGNPDAPAGWFAINLAEEPRQVTLLAGGEDMLSGEKVGPQLSLGPLQTMLVRRA